MSLLTLMDNIYEPVFLRSLETSDLERTYQWHNDRTLYQHLENVFRHVSRKTEEEWLDRKSNYDPQEISLAICIKENSEHIGNIYLRNIDWIARRANLHIFIGNTEQRGKGFGLSAIRQVLRYAFCDIGLNRIMLEVLFDNSTAIHVYKKCGFLLEGTLRKHVFKDGAFKDVVIMGICANEFQYIEAQP